MKVVVNLLPDNRIKVESRKGGWVDTLEICATASNPLIPVDYCILVTDVPKAFLEYLSQTSPQAIHTACPYMERPRCNIHVYSWNTFLKNCQGGWELNLLHDPCEIFSSEMIRLCEWLVGRFVSSKK